MATAVITRAGGEAVANTTTAESQNQPAIAPLPGGGYVVAWTSWGQDGSDGGVYVQRYDALGNRVGGETRANVFTTGWQDNPAVSGLPGGAFVVVWTSENQDAAGGHGVYARVFQANGTPASSEFLVNTTTAGDQWVPAVTTLNSGDFVVTWQ